MNTWNENNVLGRVNESKNEFSLDELMRGLAGLKTFDDDLKSPSFRIYTKPELDPDMLRNINAFSSLFYDIMENCFKGYFQDLPGSIIRLKEFFESEAGGEIIDFFSTGEDPDEFGFVSFMNAARNIH